MLTNFFRRQSASSVATHREWDISWLKMLNIKYICDLMVEEAVKVYVI